MATVIYVGGPDDGREVRGQDACDFLSEVMGGYTCELSATTGRLHGYRVRRIGKGRFRAEYLRDFPSVLEFDYLVESGLIEGRST